MKQEDNINANEIKVENRNEISFHVENEPESVPYNKEQNINKNLKIFYLIFFKINFWYFIFHLILMFCFKEPRNIVDEEKCHLFERHSELPQVI